SEHHRHRHEKNEGTQQQADQSAGPAHQQHGHGGHQHVDPDHFDLAQAALDEMHEAGFKPEFGPGVGDQVNEIRERLREEFAKAQPGFGVPDLRSLCWSSIGDVARAVEKESPIDQHAKAQTQTIYTAVKNFPMLPLELSTGMTSLNENGDRMAVMMSFTVGANGEMSDEQISRAWVRNRGQLAYSRVGPWLDAHAGATTATGVSLQDVEG